MRHSRLTVAITSALVLSVACARSRPRERAEAYETSSGQVDASTPDGAGFAVYSAQRTVVVVGRTDDQRLASSDTVAAPGLLIATEGLPHRVSARNTGPIDGELSRHVAEQLWLARCSPFDEAEERCLLPNDNVEIETEFTGETQVQRVRGCACLYLPYADHDVFIAHGVSIDPSEDESTVSDDEDNACLENDDDDVTEVGLFGGVLQQLSVADNDACSGVHVVDSHVDAIPLVAGARLPDAVASTIAEICVDGGMGEIPWQVPIDFPADGSDDSELGCTPGDGVVWSIHRGQLVQSTVGTDAVVSCACHERAPATAATCPAVEDPCGPVAAFAELARTADDFWIGNTGTLALRWSDPPQLLAKGGREHLDIAWPRAPHGETVIGVRYHADARPLASAARRALAEDDRAFGWLPWPLRLEAAPASAEPEAVRPAASRADAKAEGNRCFAEYKRGQLDAAVATCEGALTRGGSDATRGSIYHSLGRISEDRGNDSAARVFYRTSLRLREHEATREALRALVEQHERDIRR